MSRTLTVAYSELTRVLPWSLRALGYPFGTAERGAHLVATAAALEPDVLDEIAKAGQRPGSTGLEYNVSDGALTIEANGVSLLEAGPVAIDYLAAHVNAGTVLICQVIGATELSLAAAVIAAGADYGPSTIAVIFRNDHLVWYVAQAGNEGSLLLSGTGRDDLLGVLALNPDVAARIGALDGAPGNLSILATGRPLPLDLAGKHVTNPKQKMNAAHRGGIAVTPQTLDALYALEMLTWAPTSERSRSQAGFSNPPVPA